MNFETVFLFVVAGVAIASAILMVTRRNPIMSVLFLIVNFFCLALLYLALKAQFIAIIQILVYAGAIMVLFLFVIMLLNLKDERTRNEKPGYTKIMAVALACVVLGELLVSIVVSGTSGPLAASPMAAQIGTVESIGKVMFSQYVLPFEVTSIVLLAAIVGVVVLAKRGSE
ncbi:MAG: NADH-quinone oxidoreductase subunit J [Bacteroidota bacterium]|jgi:NADH-quinone oxidoreductase subunit J